MQMLSAENITPPPRPLHAPRNASYELLRIFCMLFIILSHFAGHGGWLDNLSGYNYVVVKILHCLFLPSVNLFVMISAYFGCMRKDAFVPWKKIGKLYLQLQFYNLLLFTLFTSAGLIPFDHVLLIETLFPLARGKYWFFSAYAFMMILSPLLNAFVRRLNKKQHFIVCVAIALLSVCQTAVFNTMIPLQGGYSGVWFCLLYVIAAYLRKYDISIKSAKLSVILCVLYAAFMTMGYFLYLTYSDFPVLFSSVFVFLIFKNLKIKGRVASKAICAISALTFGIYLIHDSPEMRAYMYQNIFFSHKFYDSKVACLILIGFVFATFAACGTVEYLRQLLFKFAYKLYAKTLKGKLCPPAFLGRMKEKFNSYFDEDDDTSIGPAASPAASETAARAGSGTPKPKENETPMSEKTEAPVTVQESACEPVGNEACGSSQTSDSKVEP